MLTSIYCNPVSDYSKGKCPSNASESSILARESHVARSEPTSERRSERRDHNVTPVAGCVRARVFICLDSEIAGVIMKMCADGGSS